MDTRRVTVTLEVETDYALGALRKASWWSLLLTTPRLTVLQAQANVVRSRAKKRT